MIILTLNPQSNSVTKRFKKSSVTIGRGGSKRVDLPLNDHSLEPEHIKIVEFSGEYTAINLTNDPFATLNDLPFWKKKIQNGDILAIGKYKILFGSEIQVKEAQKVLTKSSSEEPKRAVEEKIWKKAHTLGKDTYQLQTDTPHAIHKLPTSDSNRVKSFSQKIWKTKQENPSYLPFPEEENVKPGRRKRFFFLAACLLLLSLFTIFSVYEYHKDQFNQQEIEVAQGIADISAALTYAELNKIQPANKNWNDPDFLSDTINTILPQGYHPMCKIDSTGNFTKSPYLLRVYTNEDGDHFVVIAQPLPSMWQWIIPRKTIIFDSNSMEIRKTKGIREINRLLAKSNTLQETDALALSAFFRQGIQIPLQALQGRGKNLGFSPPRELAYLRPGAEAHIYNAPRYYKLGEDILKQAMKFSKVRPSPIDELHFSKTFGWFKRFADMVLYTPDGMNNAFDVQQGLARFPALEEHLIGHFQFDSEQKIANAQLLLISSTPITGETRHQSLQDQILEALSSKPKEKIVFLEERKNMVFPMTEKTDLPYYWKVYIIAWERKTQLQKIEKKIARQLKKNRKSPQPEFSRTLATLLQEYEEAESGYQSQMREVRHAL